MTGSFVGWLIGLAVLVRPGQVIRDLRGNRFAKSQVVMRGEVQDADNAIREFLFHTTETFDMLGLKAFAISFKSFGQLRVHQGDLLSCVIRFPTTLRLHEGIDELSVGL